MKVCIEHKSILPRGITYEIVPSEECEVCKLLKRYED